MILQKIRSKTGFTLIELMIVVAIIAITGAIMIPMFANLLSTVEGESDQVEIVDQSEEQPVEQSEEETPKPQKEEKEKL